MRAVRFDRTRSVMLWPALRSAVLVVVVGSASLHSAPATADAPDWGDVRAVETVTALTQDEKGDVRETTIWLVMVDGQAYIRTSNRSGWGKDVARNPAIALRVEGVDYPVTATFVGDPDERERVAARFREKYGFEDAFIGILRGSNPPIMRLDARNAEDS